MRINDQNGNSRVEPMETAEMTVRVQAWRCPPVSADVQVGKNVFLAGDAQTIFCLLHPVGQYCDFKFMFYTNTALPGEKKIPITVSLNEALTEI